MEGFLEEESSHVANRGYEHIPFHTLSQNLATPPPKGRHLRLSLSLKPRQALVTSKVIYIGKCQ